MTVRDAIDAAEAILPGTCAPEGEIDVRWQAIIRVGDFIETDPDDVLEFVLRWGKHEDDDLRAAVATCLLEHLLEHHFDRVFPRLAEPARRSAAFKEMCRMCWYNHGDMSDPSRQAEWRRFLMRGDGGGE